MAARKKLPKKKILNTAKNKKKKAKEAKLSKVLTQLGRWISIGRINIRIKAFKENIEELNEELRYINQQQASYIDTNQNEWSNELIEDLKGWWKIFYMRRKSEIDVLRRKEIEDYTEKRCQMINNDQGKMLRSLLDKPSNKINLDRLIEEENGQRKLLIEPTEVMSKTKNHFQKQLRMRHFRLELLENKWKEIYRSKKTIEAEWYKNLDQDITEEEWSEMLASLKKNTAPGITGITYSLIQAANIQTQRIFRTFAEICIKSGLVPKK